MIFLLKKNDYDYKGEETATSYNISPTILPTNKIYLSPTILRIIHSYLASTLSFKFHHATYVNMSHDDNGYLIGSITMNFSIPAFIDIICTCVGIFVDNNFSTFLYIIWVPKCLYLHSLPAL